MSLGIRGGMSRASSRFASATPPGPGPDIVFAWDPNDGFEDNTFEWKCRSEQFTLVTSPSPVFTGTKSCRFFQHGNRVCLESGTGPESKHRTQLMFRFPGSVRFRVKYNAHYWFGWATYYPSSLPTTTAQQYIHISIFSKAPGDMGWLNRGTNNPSRHRISFKRRTRNASNNGDLVLDSFDFDVDTNAWHTFVTHLFIDEGPLGIQEHWVDGVLVKQWINLKNGTNHAIRGEADPFMKIGIYWGQENRSNNFEINMSSIRIAQALSAFSQVDPTQDL